MPRPHHNTAQIETWLDLLRQGDRQARDRLIEHACERLRAVTRSMLRGSPRVHRWEETDDVFVEAMNRLHRSLRTVQPLSARDFYNLAATQIRRVLIDLARHYYGPQRTAANEAVPLDGRDVQSDHRHPAADHGSEPANLAEWTEFHRQVESLPGEEREVFSLLWYEGLTQEAAAQALGISPRTLARRWHQARQRLYSALHGERPPE